MKKIREGYKITEVGEIPSEWEVKKLKDIASICYGKSQKEVEVDNGKYKILGTGGIIGYTNDFLWNEPSVLIGRKGTIDKPQYIEEPFWTVDTLFYTKLSDNYIAKWLYYYLDNIDLKKYNEATGVPSLSVANLNTISIATPQHDEQEKIASILSTVDEQIDNVDELIQKNKELKKGLMQQLLTKGIGHTKFKKTEIGEIPEDWEVKNLGEICEFRQGFQIQRSEQILNEKDGYIRYLYITDFFSDSNKLYIKDSDKYYYIGTKDIAIANTGNTCGKAFRGAMGVLSNNMFKIFNDKNIISDNYLWHYLNSDYYWNELSKYFNTAGQPHVGHKNMSQLKVAIPKQLIEQERIALILSEFDEKIEEYENKKQKLEELKKGLMQQLLTGKIRVRK